MLAFVRPFSGISTYTYTYTHTETDTDTDTDTYMHTDTDTVKVAFSGEQPSEEKSEENANQVTAWYPRSCFGFIWCKFKLWSWATRCASQDAQGQWFVDPRVLPLKLDFANVEVKKERVRKIRTQILDQPLSGDFFFGGCCIGKEQIPIKLAAVINLCLKERTAGRGVYK